LNGFISLTPENGLITFSVVDSTSPSSTSFPPLFFTLGTQLRTWTLSRSWPLDKLDAVK